MFKPFTNESTDETFCVECGFGADCHGEDGTCPIVAEDVIDEDGKQFRAIITDEAPADEFDAMLPRGDHLVTPAELRAFNEREQHAATIAEVTELRDFARETYRDETPEWAQGIRADY